MPISERIFCVISPSPHLEALTKIAAESLSEALGATNGVVRLNINPEQDQKNGY